MPLNSGALCHSGHSNFWRNALGDVSVRLQKEQSVTIGYHSSGWKAVGWPLFGERRESSLSLSLRWQGVRVSPREWSSADRGQAYCWGEGGGGATVQQPSPCLTHRFGIKHVCVLSWCWYPCGLQLFVTAQPRELCIATRDTFSLHWQIGLVQFSKTGDWRERLFALCASCLPNIITNTAFQHTDEAISYGEIPYWIGWLHLSTTNQHWPIPCTGFPRWVQPAITNITRACNTYGSMSQLKRGSTSL